MRQDIKLLQSNAAAGEKLLGEVSWTTFTVLSLLSTQQTLRLELWVDYYPFDHVARAMAKSARGIFPSGR